MDKLTKEYKALVRGSWRLFYLSHRAWSKSIEALGLSTSNYPVLEIAVQRPGVTQQEIADELSVDKSCASRACRFLESRGFICREKSPDCAHGLKCVPTEKGREAVAQVLALQQAHIHALFEDIDTGALESSNGFMLRLIEKLCSQTEENSAD